jgi:hypothetical protein
LTSVLKPYEAGNKPATMALDPVTSLQKPITMALNPVTTIRKPLLIRPKLMKRFNRLPWIYREPFRTTTSLRIRAIIGTHMFGIGGLYDRL